MNSLMHTSILRKENDENSVEIKPCFATDLDYAKAHHVAPAGKIVSGWKRENDKIILNVEIPDKMTANAVLEKGYVFADGCSKKAVKKCSKSRNPLISLDF